MTTEDTKKAKVSKVLLAVFLTAVFSLGFFSIAQALNGYEINWWTVDGGGVMNLEAGGYSLSGTTGQADAGLLTSGDYGLDGGFWVGGPVAHKIFAPLVRR